MQRLTFYRILFTTCIISGITIGVSRYLTRRHAAQTFDRLNKVFQPKNPATKELGIYDQALPQFWTGSKKKHGVLLIHSYAYIPYSLKSILPKLQNIDMDYYVPLLSGWGRTHFIEGITWQDWLLDCVKAYDLMSSLYEKVSIIAHSSSSLMALYLASHYKVEHLILSSPNLKFRLIDRQIQDLLNTPVLGQLIELLDPIYRKPVRKNRSRSSDTLYQKQIDDGYWLASATTSSLRALFDLQDRPLGKIMDCKDITILFGEQDATIDDKQKQINLIKNSAPEGVSVDTYMIPNSSHNIFLEAPEVVDQAFAIIKKVLE